MCTVQSGVQSFMCVRFNQGGRVYLQQTERAYEKCTVSLTLASHGARNVCPTERLKISLLRQCFKQGALLKMLGQSHKSTPHDTELGV